jgi:hypothetical protein
MNFEEILAQLAATKELLVQFATMKELLAANQEEHLAATKELLAANQEELLAAIKGDQTQVSSLNSLPLSHVSVGVAERMVAILSASLEFFHHGPAKWIEVSTALLAALLLVDISSNQRFKVWMASWGRFVWNKSISCIKVLCLCWS